MNCLSVRELNAEISRVRRLYRLADISSTQEGGLGSVVYATLLSNQFLLNIVSGLFTYTAESVSGGCSPPLLGDSRKFSMSELYI
jgi:hypothetical protein